MSTSESIADLLQPKYPTADLVDLLRKKYPAPAFSVLEQVRSCTGYAKDIRTCDAMVMSLYPSRGVHLSGFEIKVSRSDWARELKQPAKAEVFQPLCHYWYLLTGSEAVAQADEIPQTWGWMVKKNGALKLMKEAPFNPNPKLDHYFLASVFRTVTEGHVTTKESNRAVREARAEGVKAGAARYDELLKELGEFETISGVNIINERGTGIRWDYRHVGEAVRMVMESKHLNIQQSLLSFKEQLGRMVELTNKALEAKKTE